MKTFYAGGLRNPVEYPLCKNAVQLAQAKGLHREPSASWGLSQTDVLMRNWLWWTIYYLDKQIALRSGRPSSIDDDDISTPIPTSAPPGSTVDVDVLTLMIRHAQICSQIGARIMSVKASKQSFAEARQNVKDIHSQLQELLQSLPAGLDLKRRNLQAPFLSIQQRLEIYLHFSVHGTLMATHVIFFYPWISFRFRSDLESDFHDQVNKSTAALVAAAREILVMLKTLRVDATCPAWLAFFYPMYAYINLFIYILKFPQSPTVVGDLALLDICAGHFGQIDHATDSEISIPFPRQCTALCFTVVKASKGIRKTSRTEPATPEMTSSANGIESSIEALSQSTPSGGRSLFSGAGTMVIPPLPLPLCDY